MELKKENTECQMKRETELTARRIGSARLACEGKAQKQTDTEGKIRA